MISENVIKQACEDYGIDEREARLMLLVDSEELPGDVLGVPYIIEHRRRQVLRDRRMRERNTSASRIFEPDSEYPTANIGLVFDFSLDIAEARFAAAKQRVIEYTNKLETPNQTSGLMWISNNIEEPDYFQSRTESTTHMWKVPQLAQR
jgi:hypothetical protein